ncbi:DUF2076 domain-containing protein [Mangrovicella endophytica]|uniref:DUF2076 domain-containing protein n=1 Tax=Mangrovicella endophytica TaxID=2066697 RepID=UPI000C9DB1A1|nr:DUF2076 domain-containing protein [Mangrovicella endophytica]
MNHDEQNLIRDLFGKLSEAERSAPPRDAEADRFIQESVARQPGAPYYMAQTIIIQEQALEAAQARIQELESQASRGSGGGIFGSLFGGGAQAARTPQRRPAPGGYGQSAGYGEPQRSGPWSNAAPGAYGQGGYGQGGFGRQGGGFLAGAAQTAMGVAGGVMLGSMLSNLFTGDETAAGETAGATETAAAETDQAAQAEPASFEDDGGADFGGDFEDI